MLGVSPGQAAEVAVDAELRGAPAAPAAEVYTGVLYERLGLPALPARAQRRVLIASALWGVVRPEDRIPYYRLSAKAKLPKVGALAAFWRPALARGAAGRGPGRRPDRRHALRRLRGGLEAEAGELLAVRAFSEAGGSASRSPTWRRRCGAKSRRALLEAKRAPEDAAAAAAIAEAAGFRVELGPGTLDVIVPG